MITIKVLEQTLFNYLFFTVIESLYFTLYFVFDNRIKFNKKQLLMSILGISIMYPIIKMSLPQVLSQIVAILYMSLILSIIYRNNIKNSILSVVKSTMFMLVIETIIMLAFSNIFGFSMKILSNNTSISLLIEVLITLSFRIVEFGFIYYLYKRR